MYRNDMTKQEIVNMVAARLRDGTGRSAEYGEGCFYRNRDDLRCAVGIFIPVGDDIENCRGGNDTLMDNAEEMDNPIFSFLEKNYDLLADLQKIHDEPKNWTGKQFNDRGEAWLKNICDYHGLEY